MNLEQLESLVIQALEDLKGKDIKVLDVAALTSMTDKMVVVSGTSNRHVKALANNIVMDAKKAGTQPVGVEGDDVGEWVLVDLGDLLIHVMLPEIRGFYDIERLWSQPAFDDESEA
ncbi:Ribosomal silencing factor RsfS [BD1-7 clade bacterium]|uniref:Ribosomal silencing factor RsfS n=1 Tax=BD1-7 clade bacterium TaxID=2029982 RepID=A0A5S9PVA2_9GAMM|nr:Ribosomal silencing factor RsfS [BD1-7 clade bacterium]CAA0108970.1 Ribosomal silencing factor RsfS [BD1-7 clade bacterium]